MPGTTLPPFPDDVRTHRLLTIDYELIKAGDKDEENRLWKAATTIGYWYLKNHGADQEVSDMFDMGSETMALPFEERMKFGQGEAQYFGYKKLGANVVNAAAMNLNTSELINVSKDDALAYPQVVHRTYPSTVNARMADTIAPFVRKTLEVNYAVLNIFNEKLGLPQGTLERLHAMEEHSTSNARCIRTPPQVKEAAEKPPIGAHADFGSLVVYERWSLSFFTRPGNSEVIRALIESSPLIAEAVKKQPDRNFEIGSTAAAWLAMRMKNNRINNETEPDTWAASRGPEYTV
ncbi:hypothetical protein AZE42_10155 [Rhizopogon vesiculosus]|uniref:Non-haem dioxygenase N-terminal domain-containing protein n=1 Tax=Rhizopogon vesiculosus TaxID=180088 RepID=A0A1J8QVF6_9AGAM|nr:hypothetical protein AZE42_10155 [Rhizopogon vesiculosus]